MSILRVVALVLLAGVVLATQSGCLVVAAAAGAGATVAYVKGETEATVAASPEKATAAAKWAVEDMKLTVISSHSTTVDGAVVARTASDDKVQVEIKSAGDNLSKVCVRVNTFGDSALQQSVMDRIKNRLSSTATTE